MKHKLCFHDGHYRNWVGDKNSILGFLSLLLGFILMKAGKGPNHLGEGWRERNGLRCFTFTIILRSSSLEKEALCLYSCLRLGPFENDNALIGNTSSLQFNPHTCFSRYLLWFFYYTLKNPSCVLNLTHH